MATIFPPYSTLNHTHLLRYTPIMVEDRLRKIIFRFVDPPRSTINIRGQVVPVVTRPENDLWRIISVVGEIKALVFRAAHNVGYPVTRREIMGTLTLYAPEYNVGKSLTSINIADLTHQDLQETISQMVQSNAVITLDDLEFQFYYYSQHLLVGAGNVSKPKWWKSKDKVTWSTYEDNQGPINCAAFALAYALDPHALMYALKEQGRELQTRLGWGEYVSIAQIKDFVLEYTDYRVTVFLLQSFADSSQTTFVGEDWVNELEDGAQLPPKTVYLYYHVNGNVGHYVHIKSISTVMRNYKPKTRYSFCHKCVRVYGSTTQHPCALKPVKKVLQKCNLGCGVFHGQEKCPRIKCRTCENQFKRREEGGEYIVHKCLIKSDMKDPIKFQQNGCDDGKLPALLVWDIESAFKRVVFEKVYCINRLLLNLLKNLKMVDTLEKFLLNELKLISMSQIWFVSRMFLVLWKKRFQAKTVSSTLLLGLVVIIKASVLW